MDNLLLARLPPAELQELRPQLREVSLSHGQPIITPDEPITYIYFPISALLSLVTILEDGSAMESGTIGREGMSGVAVLLNAKQTTMETLTQIAGRAYRIKAARLKEIYNRAGTLHDLLNRYMHTLIVLTSQSAACNARHLLDQRVCRWLLMSSDGIGSDELGLTQEYLAVMLGVRRSGVSEAASKLQEAGLIRYSRGSIKILNRAALEESACECYGRTKTEYDRLFGNLERPIKKRSRT
jgi:CRP-like cAMP-binding protein